DTDADSDADTDTGCIEGYAAAAVNYAYASNDDSIIVGYFLTGCHLEQIEVVEANGYLPGLTLLLTDPDANWDEATGTGEIALPASSPFIPPTQSATCRTAFGSIGVKVRAHEPSGPSGFSPVVPIELETETGVDEHFAPTRAIVARTVAGRPDQIVAMAACDQIRHTPSTYRTFNFDFDFGTLPAADYLITVNDSDPGCNPNLLLDTVQVATMTSNHLDYVATGLSGVVRIGAQRDTQSCNSDTQIIVSPWTPP
ncbi:MAG: hypothetical protein KC621_33190, partial [Myxococcales bacterium]|nr:hypothetical protein [Myxococcales bacterium]